MTQPEQINAFHDDLLKLITRYTAEFSLPLASAVGVLEVVKHDLLISQKPVAKECDHQWTHSWFAGCEVCNYCHIKRPASDEENPEKG